MDICVHCHEEYQGEVPDICDKCGKHTTQRFTEALCDYLQGEGYPLASMVTKAGEVVITIPFKIPSIAQVTLKEINKLSIEPTTNG